MSVELTPRRVLTYEPNVGMPASHDPLEVASHEYERDRLRSRIVLDALLGAAFLVFAFVLGHPVTALAGVLLLLVAAWYSWALIVRGRPARKLLEFVPLALSPGEGELLVSGQKVSISLPGAERRWIVVRLSRGRRALLAGERRVFVLGPDVGGRMLVVVPGGFRAGWGRVRNAPAPRSENLAAVPRTSFPAAQDPVLAAHLRDLWRGAWIIVSVAFLTLALLIGCVVVLDDLPTSVLQALIVFGVLFLCLLSQVFGRIRFMAGSVRAQPWWEFAAALNAPIKLQPACTGTTSALLTLPDGAVAEVRFLRQSLDLLINVRDTGRLWVLGDPSRRRFVVGLPGYPVLGVAQRRS